MDCECKKNSKKYNFIFLFIIYVLSFATYHVINLVTQTTNYVLPPGNILNI
jgi:hypothetical protein